MLGFSELGSTKQFKSNYQWENRDNHFNVCTHSFSPLLKPHESLITKMITFLFSSIQIEKECSQKRAQNLPFCIWFVCLNFLFFSHFMSCFLIFW